MRSQSSSCDYDYCAEIALTSPRSLYLCCDRNHHALISTIPLRSRILFFQIAPRLQSSFDHDHQGEIIITSLGLRFHRQGRNPDLGIADTTFQNCVAMAIIFLQSRSSRRGRYNFAAITISTPRSCRYSKRDLLQLHRYY